MRSAVTCADLAAVGPDVLTKWKVEVLAEWFAKTLANLEQQQAPSAGLADQRREEIPAHLTADDRRDPWFQRQIAALHLDKSSELFMT